MFLISFRNPQTTMCIPIENIMYLTYWEHKIELITSTTEKYEFRGTMKECLNQLKEESFFRVNSGAIVNLRYAKNLKILILFMEDNNINSDKS